VVITDRAAAAYHYYKDFPVSAMAAVVTMEEQAAVLQLLGQAQRLVQAQHSPDGYNIGVNVGKAGGQSRMHVHMHLIPRYAGDVSDPRGGIRCVLAGKSRPV
jgi:diadenosine tetraphosphate (Ap4A) HIT family hydrolase